MQGWLDPPLAPVGFDQAQQLAKRLEGVEFSAVYSSNLSRAEQTAQALTEGRSVEPVLLSDLRETGHGEWDGLTLTEIRAQYPMEYDSFMGQKEEFVPPGGESVAQVTKRASTVTRELRSLHSGHENLLIVSHSGTLRALLVTLLALPLAAYWSYRVNPCALSIIQVLQENAVVELWNDVSHISGLAPNHIIP